METKKKSPKITDYTTHMDSPFVVHLSTKQYSPNPEHKHMQGDDGKEYGMYEIPKNKTILCDTAQYTKLFNGKTSILMGLSEPAMRMFYYITDVLKPNRDEVSIHKELFFEFAGYKTDSRLPYYRAIEGLLSVEIIARKAGSTTEFFINPDVVYNGDRTKLKNVITNDKRSFKLDNEQ
jgi:hypothetical protein